MCFEVDIDSEKRVTFVASMIQSQLMSSRNLATARHMVCNLVVLVNIQQSLSPDRSLLGNILAINHSSMYITVQFIS